MAIATFLESPIRNFRFVTLPQEIPERKSLEIQKSKTKTHGNSALVFFLNTPRISTSFLIDPWHFHMFFLQDPWKFHVLNPPPPRPPPTPSCCLDFFWNILLMINLPVAMT